MTLFNIISAIAHTMFGKHINYTENFSHTTLYKREAHTMPVVYESHDPLTECFDMSADSMRIDNEEFAKYKNLQDDIDIHNVLKNQSVILHDTLRIDYGQEFMYIDRLRSKDIVYNTNTTEAQTLNEQKFSADYRHRHVMKHAYTIYSNTYIDTNVALMSLTLLELPVNMLKLSRDILANGTSENTRVSEVYNKLKNATFTFQINNYMLVVHNADIVSVDVQRVLSDQKICAMCVSIYFTSKRDNSGSIEYINMHTGQHYDVYIRRSMRYYYTDISAHEGILRIINMKCNSSNIIIQSVFNITTQNTVLTLQNSSVPQSAHMTTQSIGLDSQNTTQSIVVSSQRATQRSSVSQSTYTTQSVYSASQSSSLENVHTPYMHVTVHNNSNNINTILLYALLGGIGAIICILLYKPFKRCARRIYGVIPLHTENNNDNDNITETETLV